MINKNIFTGDIKVDYDKEYAANMEKLLAGAARLSTHFKKLNLEINAVAVLSPVRVAELLNSATQDIIRYASYHPINLDETGALGISESVRAAYLTKWILIFKPLNLDQNLTDVEQVREAGIASRDTGSRVQDNGRFNFQFYCNEYLALYVASYILKLRVDGKIKTIIEYMKQTSSGSPESVRNEIDSLLYNFRYRIKHQDVYHLFYNRLLHSGPLEKGTASVEE